MSKFANVDYMLEVISMSDPTWDYVGPPDTHMVQMISDPPVTWTVGHYGIWVKTENVLFMEGNLWYPGHAAALVEGLREGTNPILNAPAARVYKVSAHDVESSQEDYARGELEYNQGLVEPWTEDDIGDYYAQLVDGNHRAAAAMVMGKERIVVTVGENYRENVEKEDWISGFWVDR